LADASRRLLFAAYPELLTPTLAIVHREIRRFLVHKTGVRRGQTGAVTLVQRFGPAANLNIHLHGLVLDGVYQSGTAECRAKLLRRVFRVDLEHCPTCGGNLKLVAVILDGTPVVKILTHLGLPARASPRAPARLDAALDLA